MQLLFALLSQKLAATNSQRGQSTVEYILVTLGAAFLAGALIKVTNGFSKLAGLFDRIVEAVLGYF